MSELKEFELNNNNIIDSEEYDSDKETAKTTLIKQEKNFYNKKYLLGLQPLSNIEECKGSLALRLWYSYILVLIAWFSFLVGSFLWFIAVILKNERMASYSIQIPVIFNISVFFIVIVYWGFESLFFMFNEKMDYIFTLRK